MAPRWDKRLRLPKSEGGATICEKHEFIEAHFRDPEMSWEVDQAVTQAKDDGKRMEARLQELGEEANNLEDALSETEADRDSLRAELGRLHSDPVAVEVPKLTLAEAKERSRGTTNPGVAFGWGYDHAVSRIQLFDPSRILKEGEREELDILRQVAKLIDDKRNAQWEKRGAGPCQRMPDEIDNLLCDWYEIQAQRELNALRSGEAEGRKG